MNKHVEAGTIRIIYTRGRTEELPFPPHQPLRTIKTILACTSLDTVNLRNGCVMLVDDQGHQHSREDNPDATEIYHSICRPGTTHRILGPVAIVCDADFAK
jgi:hypothetical protein